MAVDYSDISELAEDDDAKKCKQAMATMRAPTAGSICSTCTCTTTVYMYMYMYTVNSEINVQKQKVNQ